MKKWLPVSSFLILLTVLTENGQEALSRSGRDKAFQSANASAHSKPAMRGESPLDKALSSKVRYTLNRGEIAGLSLADASNIQVTADRGVVTLRGRVNTETEKQAITDRLQQLGGVTIVRNELVVGETASTGNPPTAESGSAKKQKH